MCNCDSSSRGVLADAIVLWHSSSLGILAAISVLWHNPGFVFLHLAGVHLLWHNPRLDALVPLCCVTSQVLEFLLVSECVTPPKSSCSCWCQFVVTQPNFSHLLHPVLIIMSRSKVEHKHYRLLSNRTGLTESANKEVNYRDRQTDRETNRDRQRLTERYRHRERELELRTLIQRERGGGGGRERERERELELKTLILRDGSVRSIWTYLTASPFILQTLKSTTIAQTDNYYE